MSVTNPNPTIIPGLRSPYETTGGIVYFGRMLDKIRLHAAGQLPVADYAANLGKGFDNRCCSFLRVAYDELKARVLAGDLNDAQLLDWCQAKGGSRTDEECEIWNGFMIKRGWRDAAAPMLAKRITESGLESAPIMTMFDYLDYDEGRATVPDKPWENI